MCEDNEEVVDYVTMLKKALISSIGFTFNNYIIYDVLMGDYMSTNILIIFNLNNEAKTWIHNKYILSLNINYTDTSSIYFLIISNSRYSSF